jgi:hypothetical protein
MCGCEANVFLIVYLLLSMFVGIWHFQQWMDEDKSMPTIKDIDSIGMILYYLFSIPSKIITPIVVGGYKFIKLVLSCKFR